ncbi:response regulator transcription factor [Brevibacterium yomogidense]|uniref:Putative two-component system response regulator n=1 Tax=Brevibacterium yomogidense TaxID=946573 RepID=A0A1X6XIC4_9MICO|nr:response regulator transcription factor [Brevibacterium yomogidense]SLM99025.1 putative two-component system response regulator [Brevibacterium yomogidense]
MSTAQPIRVLLVDDDQMVRTGLEHILSYVDDIDVVAQAGTGAEALDQVTRHFPDVVLMDIQMPVMDGIEAAGRMRNMPRAPKVITLTSFDTDDNLFRSLEAGAAGFIHKDIAPRDLPDAIRTVHDGEGFASPRATTRLMAMHQSSQESTRRFEARQLLAGLTAKEREVAELVTRGMGNREIAEATYSSQATVKTHLNRVMAKLDSPNRVGVAVTLTLAGLSD